MNQVVLSIQSAQTAVNQMRLCYQAILANQATINCLSNMQDYNVMPLRYPIPKYFSNTG
jgi:hypothetical protein